MYVNDFGAAHASQAVEMRIISAVNASSWPCIVDPLPWQLTHFRILPLIVSVLSSIPSHHHHTHHPSDSSFRTVSPSQHRPFPSAGSAQSRRLDTSLESTPPIEVYIVARKRNAEQPTRQPSLIGQSDAVSGRLRPAAPNSHYGFYAVTRTQSAHAASDHL